MTELFQELNYSAYVAKIQMSFCRLETKKHLATTYTKVFPI